MSEQGAGWRRLGVRCWAYLARAGVDEVPRFATSRALVRVAVALAEGDAVALVHAVGACLTLVALVVPAQHAGELRVGGGAGAVDVACLGAEERLDEVPGEPTA